METEAKVISMKQEAPKIDEKKVKELTTKFEKKKKEVASKLYAIKMSKDDFSTYSRFFKNEVEWVGKQALGVVEINKRITEIEKEGIKDGVIYLKNLEIEASHFFLNTHKGKGSNGADQFINVLKNIEEGLYSLAPDNKELKQLESELAAAQQGLETA